MNEIEEILNYIKRKDTNIRKLSKETGISSDKIYSWRQGRGKPKVEDAEKLFAWVESRRRLGISADELEESETKKIETGTSAQPRPAAGESINAQALLIIANANEMLARSTLNFSVSQLNFSEANKTMADNQKDMIQLAKRSTAGAQEQTIEAVLTTIQSIQDVLKEIAMGRKFGSEEELDAALLGKGNISHLHPVS